MGNWECGKVATAENEYVWGARAILRHAFISSDAALEFRGLRAIGGFRLRWMELGGFTLGCREIGGSDGWRLAVLRVGWDLGRRLSEALGWDGGSSAA